jgi:hypothetical protein
MKTIIFSLGLSLLSLTATSQCVPTVPSGLISYFPFCGSANDAVGTNNGIVYGATLTNDRFNNPISAYSFNGASDSIVFPSGNTTTLNVTGDFTFSFWFKTLQAASDIIFFGDGIYANSGGYLAGLNLGSAPLGTLGYSTQGIWHNSTNTLNDNTWKSIIISKSADTLRLWVNGILDVQTTNVLPVLSWNGGRVAGTRNDNNPNSFPFQGVLDDISLYNRALTAMEVWILSGNSSTAISEQTTAPDISIYPNPANSTITVQSNITLSHLDVYSLQGEYINTSKNVGTQIDISDLSAGYYFLKAYDLNNQLLKTVKLVKY